MVKFGTSGLRGLATDLTDQLVASYSLAFLEATGASGTVLIGQDLRASSPRIADAVAAACANHGATPFDCGVLPTPALALYATKKGAPAIMVTGSHIPADRNGLKFYTADGEIAKSDEASIVAGRRDWTGDVGKVAMQAESAALADYTTRYAYFYADRPLEGKRIGVYQHSSVARDVVPALLEAAGAVAVPLGRSGSFVPVDTEALDAETRAMLAGWAENHGLDAIVSTDGDADRPMLADAKGNIVPGDIIGALVAQSLGANTVVTPVSSNTVVEKSGYFDHVERCRIGSPYVIGEMERLQRAGHDKIVGYEANGGFLLGFTAVREGREIAPLMTRDFALPILECLAMAARAGSSLSELTSTLPPRFTASNRLTDVPMETSAEIVRAALAGALAVPGSAGETVTQTDTTDGARFELTSGLIVHIRPSGNAPELRCYVEAEDTGRANAVLERALSDLRSEVDARR